MLVLKILLILIEIITSILLVAIILIQRTKGEGLGLAFGAEMGESLFGARAPNVLVKITIWLAVIFMANTLILAKIYSGKNSQMIIERPQQTAVPTTPAPITAPTLPQAPQEQLPSQPQVPVTPASSEGNGVALPQPSSPTQTDGQ